MRAGAVGDPRLAEIADRPWKLREVTRAETVYTDDLAPVERLIDDIVVREALHGATGRPPLTRIFVQRPITGHMRLGGLGGPRPCPH